MIHPTAVIHPKAKIDPTARIGPYAVIDENVELGADCQVGAYVHLTGLTTIGPGNQFHTGCVIGDAPQDLKYRGEPTRLRIGRQNIFREHVTVNRSAKRDEDTVVGSHGFLMGNCHVGHNAVLGDYVILANGALVAGHATIGDRAFISGNCLIHQFVRVGIYALMQGGAAISQDLPPYTIARGDNGICGLNTVGLRRAGFTAEQRLELKQVYHALFRSAGKMAAKIAAARAQFSTEPARVLLEFVSASKRGVCRDAVSDPGSAPPEIE